MTRAGAVALLVVIAIAIGAGRLAASAEGELTVRIESVDDATGTAVITVIGPDGRPLVGLGADAFALTEDGQSLAVDGVARAEDASVGIAAVLAIDTSLSMEGSLDAARAGAGAVLSGLSPEDQAAIVSFSRAVEVVQPLTADGVALDDALASLQPISATSLHDAVIAAIEVASNAPLDRRVVILLTDGLDDGSVATREEALAAAAGASVPVYAIGFGLETDEAFLRELAEVSDGSFLLAPDAESMLAAYEAYASLLRSQYVVSFEPPAPTAEREHTLEVEVTHLGVTATATKAYESNRPLLDTTVATAEAAPVDVAPVDVGAAQDEPTLSPAAEPAGGGFSVFEIGGVMVVMAAMAVGAAVVMRRRRGEQHRPVVLGARARRDVAGVRANGRARASLHPLSGKERRLQVAEGDLLRLDAESDGAGWGSPRGEVPGEARLWWRDGKLMLHQRATFGTGTEPTWATLEAGDVIEVGFERFRVEIDREPTEAT